MKNNIINLSTGWLLLLLMIITACSESLTEEKEYPTEGVRLNLSMDVGAETRVSELRNISYITHDGKYGYKNMGLYIYYKEDYDRGDLSKPYVRNLECTVGSDRKIIPAEGNEDIYIYDKMTLVVFYPYNEDMSLSENWFTTSADEENYPITSQTYEQDYIPYRGIVQEVNPTNAYMARVWLYPQQTAKVEIILVSKNDASFPTPDQVKIAPLIDPLDADLDMDCRRQGWYDVLDPYTQTKGGSNVRRYAAYFWKNSSDERTGNNKISRGDMLFESDKVSLFASEDIALSAGHVYRYGYNMDTGEIFLPTSSNLVYDAYSLQNLYGDNSDAYQVCDIDLTGLAWEPLTMFEGMFDGGGHKITGLTISGDMEEAGLFGGIYGTSYLKNVNLIAPSISISSTRDICYVGALCGRINGEMTDYLLERLANSLPAGLSEVVKQAIIAEMSADILNSTSSVIGCRIENPEITITSTGGKIYTGSLCGINGTKTDQGTFYGSIWDSYILGGTIAVNANTHTYNEDAQVAGFCGMNSGFIGRSYTTTQNINCKIILQTGLDPVPEPVDKYDGFCWATHSEMPEYTGAVELNDCYALESSMQEEILLLSENWPLADNWVNASITKWPVQVRGWNSFGYKYWYQTGTSPSNYPTLQWERK